MKTIVTVYWLAIASLASAEETPAELKAWIALGASAQNAEAEISQWERLDTNPDAGSLAPTVKAIGAALATLVKEKALERTTILLIPLDQWPEEAGSAITDFATRYSDRLGEFTSLELVGMGAKTKLSTFKKGEPFELTVHLPTGDLPRFRAQLKKAGLLAATPR